MSFCKQFGWEEVFRFFKLSHSAGYKYSMLRWLNVYHLYTEIHLNEENFITLESRFGVNPSSLPVAATVSDHRQNHRFLRAGQEGKQKVWWLFDHLNSLVSTGSGACEKVGGTSATTMRSKKLRKQRVSEGTPYLIVMGHYFDCQSQRFVHI